MAKNLQFSGSMLNIRRKFMGYSREVLAKKIGCTAEAIWYWEAQKYSPNAKYIPKLAKILQTSPARLFLNVPKLK